MPAWEVRWPLVSGRRFQSRLAIQSRRMFPQHDQRPPEVNKADGEEGSEGVHWNTHSSESFCIPFTGRV